MFEQRIFYFLFWNISIMFGLSSQNFYICELLSFCTMSACTYHYGKFLVFNQPLYSILNKAAMKF